MPMTADQLATAIAALPEPSERVKSAAISLLKVQAKVLERLPAMEGDYLQIQRILEQSEKSLSSTASMLGEEHQGVVLLREFFALVEMSVENRHDKQWKEWLECFGNSAKRPEGLFVNRSDIACQAWLEFYLTLATPKPIRPTISKVLRLLIRENNLVMAMGCAGIIGLILFVALPFGLNIYSDGQWANAIGISLGLIAVLVVPIGLIIQTVMYNRPRQRGVRELMTVSSLSCNDARALVELIASIRSGVVGLKNNLLNETSLEARRTQFVLMTLTKGLPTVSLAEDISGGEAEIFDLGSA